jgi:hypothetical protein
MQKFKLRITEFRKNIPKKYQFISIIIIKFFISFLII